MVQTETTGANITAFGASANIRGVFYYGTSSGRVYKLLDAYTGKPSPIDVWPNAGFPAGGYVSSIAVDPLTADHVVVAFSNYGVKSIFATTNGGSTWSNVSGNLEENPDGTGNGPSVRSVAILPDSSAYHYFAATSTGLYSTRTLSGSSTLWQHEGTSTIGYPVVDMIAVRTSDGTIALGTHGRGAFSASIPVVEPQPPSPPETPQLIPTTVVISKNYPNPFNPGTSVTVTLAAAGQATVDVYDVSGRLVKNLAKGIFPAGISAPITWDGTDASGAPSAAGVYVIVARSGDAIQATKSMLLR
jgi:hypothetical protein